MATINFLKAMIKLLLLDQTRFYFRSIVGKKEVSDFRFIVCKVNVSAVGHDFLEEEVLADKTMPMSRWVQFLDLFS